MNRRDLLRGASAFAAGSFSSLRGMQPSGPELLKPRVLKPGDTVALITPSTSVSDPEDLLLAKRTVEYFGLKPKIGKNVGKKNGYLGGSIQERIEDLHAAFADPEVRAVFCTRGGYGAAMLLDRIDFGLIRRNPKVFIGYSDITALHLGIHQKSGLVTFHGPTALSNFSEYTIDLFRRAVLSAKPLGTLANPKESNPLRPKYLTRTMRGGKATGPLVGGNLTLIATTMGTPWEIQTDGKLLFLEDVDEQPYSMDRMLTQLRLAGKFRNIRGLVLGECTDCRPRDFKPSFNSTLTLAEVYDHILGDLKVPMVTGMTIGHTSDQITLPLGISATLDADAATLTLQEPATLE